MTEVHLFTGTLVLFILLSCGVWINHAKRSDKDLEQFASSINKALRLRYGKRSSDRELFGEVIPLPQVKDRYFGSSYDDFYLPIEENKFPSLADRFVASLNEAERLRFG